MRPVISAAPCACEGLHLKITGNIEANLLSVHTYKPHHVPHAVQQHIHVELHVAGHWQRVRPPCNLVHLFYGQYIHLVVYVQALDVTSVALHSSSVLELALEAYSQLCWRFQMHHTEDRGQ